jgi:hypothetical protein
MQLPLSLPLASLQFSAILGDLQQKQDLYVRTQSFEVSTTCHFSNCNQAGYLLVNHPHLIPSGNPWSNHSLGTFFEFHYYSNLTFRFSYLTDFPLLSCLC